MTTTGNGVKDLAAAALAETLRAIETCKGSQTPAIKALCAKLQGRRDGLQAVLDAMNGNKTLLRYYGRPPGA